MQPVIIYILQTKPWNAQQLGINACVQGLRLRVGGANREVNIMMMMVMIMMNMIIMII